jgi:uncharacterized membrane protein YbhN (UPF0104 family)
MKKILSNKYIKPIVKLLLTFSAFYIVFKNIDLHQVLTLLGHSNVWLLFAAMLFFMLSKFISAIRLNKFFNRIGIYMDEKLNIKLYLLGMYYNIFLPGGIGGDGYKIYLLSKTFDMKVKPVFWAVLLDRVTGLLALFCLCVVMFYLVPITIPYKWWLLVLVPLAVTCFYFFLKIFFKDYLSIFNKTNVLSLFVQVSQLISAILILWAIGNKTDLGSYLFLFLVSSVISTIPFTIGGAGSRELTLLFGAQWLGLDKSMSVSLSLLFYLITLIVSLFGIFYAYCSILPEIEKVEESKL